MKKLILKLLRIVVRPKIIEKIINFKNRVMWQAYEPTLNQVGDNCVVQWPFRIHGNQYITIGNNFVAGKYLTLSAFDSYRKTGKQYKPKIEIGNNITITEFCQISCIDHIKIGDGVLLGRNVFISDNGHSIGSYGDEKIAPVERELTSKGPVVIGDNVWIGRNATILSGVTIGEGAVVGANAVVTHDVPAYSVVAGCPAKIIKGLKQ